MKKSLLAVIVAALIAIPCLAGCSGTANNSSASSSTSSSTSKMKVVTSFYAMSDFAQKIGGDRVEVTNLVPAGTEPHDWEPSTNDMKELESAKVFVYNGAGMEKWVDNVLSTLDNDGIVSVKASDGIKLLTSTDEEEEGKYDPHVWLDPEYAKTEMMNIRDAFIKADPDGKKVYEDNYNMYSAKLDALNTEYKEKLKPANGKSIVVSHQAFGYLCNAYGLKQMPIEGLDADAEPDAKTMSEIVDFVKKNNVKTIFTEELVSPKVAQQIADETGATCEELNPLEGLSDEEIAQGEDYFSVMESNLGKLVKALS